MMKRQQWQLRDLIPTELDESMFSPSAWNGLEVGLSGQSYDAYGLDDGDQFLGFFSDLLPS